LSAKERVIAKEECVTPKEERVFNKKQKKPKTKLPWAITYYL